MSDDNAFFKIPTVSFYEREKILLEESAIFECSDCGGHWFRKNLFKDGVFFHCPECYGLCIKIGDNDE